MQVTSRSRWQLRLQNIIFSVLLAGIVGAAAWVSLQYKYQADWTAGNRNTLSEDSQNLLKAIDRPIGIVAYVPDDPDLRKRIQEGIDKYRRHKSDIKLEFVNPDLEPERAEKDGVTRSGQLSIAIGERRETVDDLVEQTIANALQRLAREDERWVVFLEGHGERASLDDGNQGLSRLADNLARAGFKVQQLNLLSSPAIPDNTSVLVIAGAQKNLLPGELGKIQEYVEQGGNILWLQDPGGSTDLEPLAGDLNVHFINGVIVDANAELRLVLGIKHPAVIPVVDYQPHIITEGLKYHTLFPFAGGIDLDMNEAAKWRPQPFLSSSPRTWAETAGFAGEGVVFNSEDGDTAGPLMLGIALTREQNDQQQRVIVVGDTDFLANAYVGHGSNLELALNLFNWLSQDDNLLSISPKSAPDSQLQLSKPLMFGMVVGFLLVLPLGLLAAGFGLWFKRRRR